MQTIALFTHWKANLTNESIKETHAFAKQMSLFTQQNEEALRPLRALVLMPASLIFNWKKELHKFAPHLFVQDHMGPKRQKDMRALASFDVVLTTYQTFREDLDFFQKIDWRVLVLDESQAIKNRSSKTSQAVRKMEVEKRLAISGTPIENSLADLWTLMNFLNPTTLGGYEFFKKKYQLPIEQHQDKKAQENLTKLIEPFFIRRKKEEVAPELPELTEKVFYSNMAPKQANLYEKIKAAKRNEIVRLYEDPKQRLMALQILNQLRQLACHPALIGEDMESGKFQDVLSELQLIRENKNKVLVFSAFEKHLQLFKAEFDKNKWPYTWLTGSTSQADRVIAIKNFQENPAIHVFFMTIKAGGAGLNLTAADHIFLLDPWWNPSVENQAIARAHRIGQAHPVVATRFIAKGTLEEKILEMQKNKRLLGGVIEGLDITTLL